MPVFLHYNTSNVIFFGLPVRIYTPLYLSRHRGISHARYFAQMTAADIKLFAPLFSESILLRSDDFFCPSRGLSTYNVRREGGGGANKCRKIADREGGGGKKIPKIRGRHIWKTPRSG